MPCFTLTILCPIYESSTMNSLNNVYISRLIKELRGDLNSLDIDEDNIHFQYTITFIDEDASPFLRDLRTPFFVKYIKYSYTNRLFYKNSKIKRPYIPAPRDGLLNKQVYWRAIHCEKNMIS